MTIHDRILQKIYQKKRVGGPVTEDMNLYRDLFFDSFTFVKLIAEIEEEFEILIPIDQMQFCLKAGHLIALVEEKVKEKKAYDQKRADAAGKGE